MLYHKNEDILNSCQYNKVELVNGIRYNNYSKQVINRLS